MFDIGASELLVIVIIAIIVIGPKELPLALRTAGRWIGKVRRVSSHFRTGFDAMVREAEMEDMDRKWKEQNAAIMAKYPVAEEDASDAVTDGSEAEMMAPLDPPDTSAGDGNTASAHSAERGDGDAGSSDQPPLPLDPPKKAG